jgi:vanillate O-demethylase monooxygenase subunit
MKMAFLRNTWYVAARAQHVTREFLVRDILSEPVLMYRKENGEAVAIGNRCPHRFAPLSMGKLVGDAVECGYHGLQFDCSGACVLNPHGDGKIPRNAAVKTYPIVERYGFIWIWMGSPEKADPSLIPEFSHLADPKFTSVGDEMIQEANYELVVDNLMDLSHAMFLHADYQKTDMFLTAKHDVEQIGNSLHSRRVVPGTKPPPSFKSSLEDPDQPVDYWLNVRWDAPGLCVLDIGVVSAGRPQEEGIRRYGTHLVTPETEYRTRYYYASSRNYRLNDKKADEELQKWQEVGFHQQDKPMIEAVQNMMGEATDLLSMKPILLSVDGASIRARRILNQMVAAEQEEKQLAP